MKHALIVALIFLSLPVAAQKSKLPNKITIGFSFSPDYSFRTLKNGDGSSATEQIIKTRSDIEIAKFGYTTGLSVTYNFSNLIGFETGVQYSNKGYKTKEQQLTYFPPDPGSPDRVTTIYAYQYIGIPLKAKFTFGKNKARFVTSAGFITNFLINVKQSINYKYPDGSAEKKNQSSTSGYNKIDITPMVSIGVDYKVTDKIHLSAAPTFRYGIIKTKSATVKENLWSTGLVVGFLYSLNNKQKHGCNIP